jgi:hypothetical protein
MARIRAILTLISDSIEEEFAAERTHDDLIELFDDELVTIHFMDFFLSTNSSLATKLPSVKLSSFYILFDYLQRVSQRGIGRRFD